MSLKLKAEEETILTSPFVPYSVKVYYVNNKSMTSHKILTHCVEATVESNIMMSIMAYIFELIAGRLNEYHPQVSAIINRAANFLKTYSRTPRYFQYVLKNSQDPTTGGVRHNFIDDCPLLVAMVYDFCTDYCDAFSAFFLPNDGNDMDNDIKRLIEINASMPCILGDELLSTPRASPIPSLSSNHSTPLNNRSDGHEYDGNSVGNNSDDEENSIENYDSSDESSCDDSEYNDSNSDANTEELDDSSNDDESDGSGGSDTVSQLSSLTFSEPPESNAGISRNNDNNNVDDSIVESLKANASNNNAVNDDNKKEIEISNVDVDIPTAAPMEQLKLDTSTLHNYNSIAPVNSSNILSTTTDSLLQSSDDDATTDTNNFDTDIIDNTDVTSGALLCDLNGMSSTSDDEDEAIEDIVEFDYSSTGLSIGTNKHDKCTSTFDILQSGKY
ncbi:hypothetical protein DOLIC_00142 [Dolichomitus sp. PSUC_FEM 10030005]|nr:hypothetical protein [Dolichomitus sp. PSUC_FEM 10030005]